MQNLALSVFYFGSLAFVRKYVLCSFPQRLIQFACFFNVLVFKFSRTLQFSASPLMSTRIYLVLQTYIELPFHGPQCQYNFKPLFDRAFAIVAVSGQKGFTSGSYNIYISAIHVH